MDKIWVKKDGNPEPYQTDYIYLEYCELDEGEHLIPYQGEHTVNLEDMHTKELMSLLGSSRRHGIAYVKCDEYFTRNEIKAVLDTREHIPNKAERKYERQQKAKQKK